MVATGDWRLMTDTRLLNEENLPRNRVFSGSCPSEINSRRDFIRLPADCEYSNPCVAIINVLDQMTGDVENLDRELTIHRHSGCNRYRAVKRIG